MTRPKIASAIDRAFVAAESGKGEDEAERLAKIVTREMNAKKESNETPSVEDIQDQVEQVLIAKGYAKTAKAYILYRAERSRTREAKTRLMQIHGGHHVQGRFRIGREARKREHRRRHRDGRMLKYGSEGAKQFYEMYRAQPGTRRGAPRGRHPHPRPRLFRR